MNHGTRNKPMIGIGPIVCRAIVVAKIAIAVINDERTGLMRNDVSRYSEAEVDITSLRGLTASAGLASKNTF